jgi:hypothetical protein
VYWKLLKSREVWGKGLRESNQSNWTQQSKAHPQRAYIEAPHWMST